MCMDSEGGGCSLDRRGFLKVGAVSVAGFGALGAAGAGEQDKQPRTRVLDDPRVEHGRIMFKHAGKETFGGYLARPKASGVFPGVLVIAGRSIYEEYIENTCAALALAGFVGLAPNIFHPFPYDDSTDGELLNKFLKDHTIDDALEDIEVGIDYLRNQPFIRSRGFGILGFCYGGWLSLMTAARSRDIRAVVAFHPGIGLDREELSQVQVPVQLHQGAADHSIDPKTAIQLRDEFTAHHVPVELFMYKGADHGFTAYTREFYRPDYAELSWSRTTKFLSKYLNEK
jgi:carboxymethylenebutenolidase